MRPRQQSLSDLWEITLTQGNAMSTEPKKPSFFDHPFFNGTAQGCWTVLGLIGAVVIGAFIKQMLR